MDNFKNFLANFCQKNNLDNNDILAKTQRYVNLLIKENQVMNLIGKSTIENIWTRHILDSAQLADYITNSVVDLGSGSGLPGIIMAIMRPNLNFMLIEKSPKKCVFLEKVISELDLSKKVAVLNKEAYIAKNDIFTFAPKFITCRAFKPLKEIIKLISYYQIKVDLVLLQGKNINQELLNLQNIKYEVKKSISDPEGFIIMLKV